MDGGRIRDGRYALTRENFGYYILASVFVIDLETLTQ